MSNNIPITKKNFDTLTEYGISFQIKTVAVLLKNYNFLEQIHDIITPNFYDSDAMKWIVKIIIEHYMAYRIAPTMEVFKIELDREIENKIMKESIIEKLRSIYNNFGSTDLEYVQNNFLNFVKNQVMKQAVLDAVTIIEKGNYDELRPMLDKALRAGSEQNIGIMWKEKEYFIRRVGETLRSPVATPWDVLNEIMDGGLGSGELGIVVAPGGIGKCVGEDTEIEIEYEQRLKQEKIKISDLFNRLNISDKENVQFVPNFYLKVKTPYGYKNIKNLFRTEKQQSVRCYFGNNKTLECGLDHRFKVNGEWTKVKDIKINNGIIETESGLTYLKKIHYGKEKVLYDISVEDVNCYYSNGILSHNSWMLVAIANHAVKQLGKNVIYYTMELSGDSVGLRHDARTSGFASQDIKFHQDEVFEGISKVRGNLVIKEFPTKNASIDTLRTHLMRCTTFGFKPDMVIVDYPDLLKTQVNYSKVEKRFELENIYEDTRGLAGEFKIPLWAASQANRCHILTDKVNTKDGEIEIGNVKIGTEILTHQGMKKIKYVSSIIKQPVYKIKTKLGKEIIISANHEIPTLYKKLKSISTGLKSGDKIFIKKHKK